MYTNFDKKLRNTHHKNCPFCDIQNLEEFQERIIWQSEHLFAFFDLHKKTSVEHILLCTKEHIKNINHQEPHHLPELLEMKAEALKIMAKYFPNNEIRLGFHKPPFYSIPHLHLHILALPIKSCWYNRVIYGCKLESLDKIIQKLEQQKPTIEIP